MKSVIDHAHPERDDEEPAYPWIGDWAGTVVLFDEEGEGVVIATDNDGGWEVGDYRQDWDEDEFVRFTGSVILSND